MCVISDENGSCFDVPSQAVSPQASEGCSLTLKDGFYYQATEKTEERREIINEKTKKLNIGNRKKRSE